MQWCILEINSYQENGIIYPQMVETPWGEVQLLHNIFLGSSLLSPPVWAPCASVTSIPGLFSGSPRAKLRVNKHQSKVHKRVFLQLSMSRERVKCSL